METTKTSGVVFMRARKSLVVQKERKGEFKKNRGC